MEGLERSENCSYCSSEHPRQTHCDGGTETENSLRAGERNLMLFQVTQAL